MAISLVSTIALPVTEEQRIALLRIDAEDFSHVAKRVKKDPGMYHGFDDKHLDAGILALKQYYAVALLDSKNMHAVTDRIDPFWHTHMLFSREYTAFCEEAFGHYLHHEPLDHDDTERVDAAERLYNYTLGVYDKLFSYYDRDVHKKVPRERIICVHFGATVHTKMYEQGLFPANPLMQAA